MDLEPSILLLGGGYTLEHLARVISDRASFIITSRSAETVELFKQKGYIACVADVTDSESIQALVTAHPSIKYLVDSVPPPIAYADPLELDEEYAQSLSLLGSIVTTSIYLSTTGVYGGMNGEVITEYSSTNPTNSRSKARLLAEELHQKFFKECSRLRLPAIYGPGRGIGHSIKFGKYKLIEDGSRFTNRIHVEDLADTIWFLLRNMKEGKELPSLLCVADSKPARQSEVVEYYCTEFDLPVPQVIPLARALEEVDPSMLSNQRVFNTLLLKTLERDLKFPSYKEGAASEMLGS